MDVQHTTLKLPVEIYTLELDSKVLDEEAVREAWCQLVKASGCSVITDPVLRREYDINSDKHITVIEGAIVEHPDLPGPFVLSDEPNHVAFCIREDSND